MRNLLLFFFCSLSITLQAQTYKDSIAVFRKKYKEDFLTDARSPLKAEDTSFLRFYPADHNYCFLVDFKETPDTKPFDMPTHSGKIKHFRQYGIFTFKLHGKKCTLHLYQPLDLIAKDSNKYKNDLFIPFTDETNYKETFGGGRYIDMVIQDIKDNKATLDFNKCYNPYCAFKGGYSCPIPPKENSLSIAVKAGEKLFGKKPKED